MAPSTYILACTIFCPLVVQAARTSCAFNSVLPVNGTISTNRAEYVTLNIIYLVLVVPLVPQNRETDLVVQVVCATNWQPCSLIYFALVVPFVLLTGLKHTIKTL